MAPLVRPTFTCVLHQRSPSHIKGGANARVRQCDAFQQEPEGGGLVSRSLSGSLHALERDHRAAITERPRAAVQMVRS